MIIYNAKLVRREVVEHTYISEKSTYFPYFEKSPLFLSDKICY